MTTPLFDPNDPRENLGPAPPIEQLPVDGDRPLLEQLEEYAESDPTGRDLEWLIKNVYERPDRMSVLTPVRIHPSVKVPDFFAPPPPATEGSLREQAPPQLGLFDTFDCA